ncbi:hypothetical protein FGIG_11844 [Fasciola gigantica]|uniref:Uncharacterized protein n=1 Tax=Fasciola gigantica TaxID=46835 RepID=A0A504YGB9_FASGI|nr:hypothetical protein FGIG_11844 [Fasciola gigantica]
MAQRQALLKKAAEVHARNLALVEAETQRLIAERRIRKEKELEELKRAAEEASIRRRAALEAEKAADQALLNAVAREQSYRDEVISEARAELESHYASLIEETETRLRAAEKRIEMSRRLNASLEENGAKVREFRAGPSGLTPNKIDGDHCDSLSFTENEVDGGEILRSSRLVPGASNKSLTEKSQAVSSAFPMEARDDDPLAILRAKYRHRNAGAFVPEERMFQLLYGGSQPNSNTVTSLSDDAPDPVQPVARNTQVFVTDSYSSMAALFRTRNQCGHASDSTVQDMLYGRGSGPACRDSGTFEC